MLRSLLGLLVLPGFALPAPAPKEAAKPEPPTLVGVWTVQGVTVGGKAVPAPPAAMTFEFTAAGVMTVQTGAAKPESASYKATAKANPPEVDVTPPAGANQPPSAGIYTVEGDVLTICFDRTFGAPRPKAFVSPAGSNVTVMTLKRVKPKE